MAGLALAQFNDFAEGTGSTYVQSPRELPVNLAGRRTYLWPQMFKNNGYPVGGGEDIRRSLVFRDNGTYEQYLPGAAHTWQNPQRLDKAIAQWRFSMAHMSWVDQEIILNDKITYGTDDAIFEEFVRIRDEKEMIMWTAKANGLESALWAQPNATLMEGTSSTHTAPYSLWPFVNEHANGLFPSYTPGGAWTTVEGVSPTAAATDGQWTPQQVTYGSTAQDDVGNVVSGLDNLFMACEFDAPERFTQYFEDPTMNNQKILTSRMGRRAFTALLRGGQDRFVAGNQDPSYPDPQMHGVPVKYAEPMDTAAVYANTGATALTTEALADLKGPRFIMVNCNYTYPVFHKAMYFKKGKVSESHEIPDTHVMPVTTWWNLVCWSRKHNGILSPSTDLYYP